MRTSVEVPVGHCVMLGYRYDGKRTCNPRLGFEPKAGIRYRLLFEVDPLRCDLTLVDRVTKEQIATTFKSDAPPAAAANP